jgi:ribosomal protein S18 acetylase RimI-like enzyme
VKMRRAVEIDLATVTDLTRRAYAHCVPLLGGEPMPMTEDYAPRIAAGEVWLHEDADVPIGLLVTEDHGDHFHIFSVVVAPEHQSKGIGRELLAFAEQMAREIDRPALTLVTNAMMVRNIEIYRRFGFAESYRRDHPKRPGWVLVEMEKLLGAAENRRSA